MAAYPILHEAFVNLAHRAAQLGFIRADEILRHHLPIFLNNGNITTRCAKFLESLARLKLQISYLDFEIHCILSRDLRDLNKIKDPQISFPAYYKMLRDIASNQIKRINELVRRAKNMKRRVEQDMKLPNGPEASRVLDPEILPTTRLYFIAEVDKLVEDKRIFMELFKNTMEYYGNIKNSTHTGSNI